MMETSRLNRIHFDNVGELIKRNKGFLMILFNLATKANYHVIQHV